MVGLLLICLPPARALTYRALVVCRGSYLYSGLSKLDVSFCNELGHLFLATAVRPLGLDPSAWPVAMRVAAILVMPLWEIGVAVALLVPRARRSGWRPHLCSTAALLGILGPWGLQHSTIVLVWNGAMMVEVAILFGPKLAGSEEEANRPQRDVGRKSPGSSRCSGVAVVVAAGRALGLVRRLAEPRSSTPAMSSAPRSSCTKPNGTSSHSELRRLTSHLPGADAWRRFDLTAWSRAAGAYRFIRKAARATAWPKRSRRVMVVAY